MREIIVDGSLDERLERLISVFDGGLSRYGGTGDSFTVSIGASATVSLLGSGLFSPSSGPTFLNGTIREFDLVEIDWEAFQNGQGIKFIDLLNIDGISASAASMFTLVERTPTTISGRFVESRLVSAIDSGDWQITGGDNDDVLTPARLLSLDGDDTLIGGEGNDTLAGGKGADMLDGGAGRDVADYASADGRVKIELLDMTSNGGDAAGDSYAGIEIFSGSAFTDTFLGDNDRNRFHGEGGNDDLRGRAGRDTLEGGTGDDRLNGGKGRDRLEGGEGNDLLRGITGTDFLQGGRGDDTLEGGEHNDILQGGRDDDTLDGGTGDDLLSGNRNADTFVFADGHGRDTITDFDALKDAEKIDLSAVSAIGSIRDLTDMGGAASQQGADVLIDTGGGNSILLQDVSLGNLDDSDFLF